MTPTFAPHSVDKLSVHTVNPRLLGDQNRVSVFVVEESGLPFSRPAATPRIISTSAKG